MGSAPANSRTGQTTVAGDQKVNLNNRTLETKCPLEPQAEHVQFPRPNAERLSKYVAVNAARDADDAMGAMIEVTVRIAEVGTRTALMQPEFASRCL